MGFCNIIPEDVKYAVERNPDKIGCVTNTNIEIISEETTETIVVEDMTERKNKLFNLGDAFLILPGGSGTIEEATEIISWKFLGLHNKDIIIFNYKGYWDEFFNLYTKAKNFKFGKKNLQNICKHVKTIQEFNCLFH